jgi:prepilin-type N-terminal cleavage/methylation domain-containing protein
VYTRLWPITRRAAQSAALPSGAAPGGYTLLEVLIAVSLAAALFAVLARVLSESVRSYDRQATRSELFQNGRVALDRITRELRAGGVPSIMPGEIIFPYDSNGDDVLDATRRFALEGDRLIRQKDTEPEEILAEKVASITFEGTDLTTIRLTLSNGGETVNLRTAVRHEN